MRVLIACEESQTVCKEFRALGHEAFSCDIDKYANQCFQQNHGGKEPCACMESWKAKRCF